jgi:hypothetical protein
MFTGLSSDTGGSGPTSLLPAGVGEAVTGFEIVDIWSRDLGAAVSSSDAGRCRPVSSYIAGRFSVPSTEAIPYHEVAWDRRWGRQIGKTLLEERKNCLQKEE